MSVPEKWTDQKWALQPDGKVINPDYVEHLEAEIARLTARVAELEGADKILRRMLWVRHGCPLSALYGDDGEMQCSVCRIDFKRQSPLEISNYWVGKSLTAFLNSDPEVPHES